MHIAQEGAIRSTKRRPNKIAIVLFQTSLSASLLKLPYIDAPRCEEDHHIPSEIWSHDEPCHYCRRARRDADAQQAV